MDETAVAHMILCGTQGQNSTMQDEAMQFLKLLDTFCDGHPVCLFCPKSEGQ